MPFICLSLFCCITVQFYYSYKHTLFLSSYNASLSFISWFRVFRPMMPKERIWLSHNWRSWGNYTRPRRRSTRSIWSLRVWHPMAAVVPRLNNLDRIEDHLMLNICACMSQAWMMCVYIIYTAAEVICKNNVCTQNFNNS